MKSIIIGRSKDCDIVLDQNNKALSRTHAIITEVQKGVFEIEDVSKYGTFVNGRKVKGKMPLKPQDRIVAYNVRVENWYETICNKPDIVKEEPKQEPPVVIVQQVQEKKAPAPDNSVLYDFDIDVEQQYSLHTQQILGFISDFRNTSGKTRRGNQARHYSEDLFELLLEQYNNNCEQVVTFLERLKEKCNPIRIEFERDNKKLDNTYQYRLLGNSNEQDMVSSLNEVELKKKQCRRLFTKMKEAVLSAAQSVIDEFYEDNPTFFQDRYELATSDSAVWRELDNKQTQCQSALYLGEDEIQIDIFEETLTLKKRVYVHSLCGGSLQIIYNRKHRSTCFELANTLISRMLTSTSNGGLKVFMVDLNEMEGTCGEFKYLNNKVYSIISRYDELTKLLGAITVHIENVIHNLLKGEISTLSDYNREKANKEPYNLLVFKDIPTGLGSEVWNRLSSIMRNGPRAGVSVMLLVNDDTANRSEEMRKEYHFIQSCVDNSMCETVNFVTQEMPNMREGLSHDIICDNLSDSRISAVVKRVNQALEVKTETILHFSDYMLPEKEWWTGQSANRIDLPFGLSNDMKTTALQITQESGQNSAVVIGIPGSGKSVFLHTIIASAITHYSPKELQLYLLDFSGVEFNVYANHKLPHARVIAPEAEREFGLSILKEVFEEGNRRMALCRENGVTNIVELKRNNPEMVVPRLLVIIDEFQKIFEIENDNISKDANSKIHAIIQEYRKFGINLILATQKLPAKSIVPYDLIANRVVFKSDPNDFANLISWSYSTQQPRLQTGICVYNNESGAEIANELTHSFFINASKELEELLENVKMFAMQNPGMLDDHELRTFRSDELPEFGNRALSDRHVEQQDIPREVGVYVGESIAIAPCHVYVPLTKDSNNNILIIGGRQDVAKGIAYHTLVSEITNHTYKSCSVLLMNFMMEDDPMRELFQSDVYATISEHCNLQEASASEDVKDFLQFIKDEVIDKRKNDPSISLSHFYINIFDFQRGRMFDGIGSRGDMQSECGQLLEYIMKNGPMVGVYTILQVDNLANLNRLCYGAQNLFSHRIALQMSEQDSDKIVGSSAANKLLVLNRPATNYRGLYYNNVNNSITKFKPYSYGSISNK